MKSTTTRRGFLKTTAAALMGTAALASASLSMAAIDVAATNTALGVAEASAHSVGTTVIGIIAGLAVIGIVIGLVRKF